MSKLCVDICGFAFAGTTGKSIIVEGLFDLLIVGFQRALHINKITSWYQLCDSFENFYYYFGKFNFGLLALWDLPGSESTVVG